MIPGADTLRAVPTIADRAEIEFGLETLGLFSEPGAVAEVRILKTGLTGVVSGYFDNITTMADAVYRAATNPKYSTAPGVYYSLNPVDPVLLARAMNRLQENARFTTSDVDVVRRLRLLVDIDPVRPAGISASDEEHALAVERAQQIEHDRRPEWGEGLICDTGNGMAIIYFINLPNDPESLALVTAVLKQLHQIFSDSRVKVDTSTANAARILKAFGTVARKGDPTLERPHRLARVLSLPLDMCPIPVSALRHFARLTEGQNSYHYSNSSQDRSRADRGAFDMEGYLTQQGWLFRSKDWSSHAGGRIFELETCPFDPEHKHGSAACMLVEGQPGFSCKHNGCAGKNIQELFAQYPPRQPWAEARDNDVPTVDFDRIPRIHSLPSKGIEYAVQDLIALNAVTLIAGPPGAGKGYLVSKIAACVAQGAEFLGRACAQRKALLFDRENTRNDIKDRFDNLGILDTGEFRVWAEWPEMPEMPDAGASCLLEWAQRTEPKPLLVFDSAIAFLNGDENDAHTVRDFMRKLKRLADTGAAVVLLHHPGKGETSRKFRGSSDFAASADVAFTLTNSGKGGLLGDMRLQAFKHRFVVTDDLAFRYRNGEFLLKRQPDATDQVQAKLEALLALHPDLRGAAFEKLAVEDGLGRNAAREFLKGGKVISRKGDHNAIHYSLRNPL